MFFFLAPFPRFLLELLDFAPPAPCRAAGVKKPGVAAAAAPPCWTLGVEGPDVAAAAPRPAPLGSSRKLEACCILRFSCLACPPRGRRSVVRSDRDISE